MYKADAPFPVFCHDCWWSDEWSPLNYGQDYDFNKPFFQQFAELQNKVPHAASYETKNERCAYCNYATHNKGCYLLFGSWFNENSGYSQTLLESRECWDCIYVKKSELCLSSADLMQCSKVIHSINCSNCIDSAFLYDCRNCQNCLFSWNLRNKNYYIFNEPVSKEEFARRKEELLGSNESLVKNMALFKDAVTKQALHKFMTGERNHNVSGDLLYGCKNVRDSFYIHDGENEKFAVRGGVGQKDSMDIFGVHSGELIYECNSVDFSSRCFFGTNAENNVNAVYALDCEHTNNIFGCTGLRKKDFCILNKQYTKEEFEILKEKIIIHMNEMPFVDKKNKVYKYGEFFPSDLSPHAYNESIAQEWVPLSEEKALALGYGWDSVGEKNYEPTISWKDLQPTVAQTEDGVLKEIILCQAWDENKTSAQNHKCTKAFRITEDELLIYRRLNVPLPRKCPNTRYFELSQMRSRPEFFHRSCMCTLPNHDHESSCPNEFETSYAPGRPDKIYCESCYNKEVY